MTGKMSPEDDSTVSVTTVLWTNSEEAKVLQSNGFSRMHRGWNKMMTKTLSSTGADILNCLHLNVVYIYFASDL